MAMHCTKCEGTGFLNNEAGPPNNMTKEGIPELDHEQLRQWCLAHPDSDFQVCDCCGDGENWYGTPGEHYNSDDPMGMHGPYASNGGLCKCH